MHKNVPLHVVQAFCRERTHERISFSNWQALQSWTCRCDRDRDRDVAGDQRVFVRPCCALCDRKYERHVCVVDYELIMFCANMLC